MDISQLRDPHAAERLTSPNVTHTQEHTMVTETPDRKVNTDAPIRDDGAKRLPHERDESPDGKDKAPRGVMQQAASDLEQGLVDTDLHGARGQEQAVDADAGSGQAQPQKDANKGMRHHDSTMPVNGGSAS
jgi:hypothetical protein